MTDWDQQWDPPKEMNLGSRMAQYWECQWDWHLAPLRGWWMEKHWVLPLADCLGCH